MHCCKPSRYVYINCFFCWMCTFYVTRSSKAKWNIAKSGSLNARCSSSISCALESKRLTTLFLSAFLISSESCARLCTARSPGEVRLCPSERKSTKLLRFSSLASLSRSRSRFRSPSPPSHCRSNFAPVRRLGGEIIYLVPLSLSPARLSRRWLGGYFQRHTPNIAHF